MHSSLKILHLEDVVTDSILIERELRKAKLDFEIKVVDNKFDYKNALDIYHPDLIISDHTLPSFNSLEAIAILKQCNKKIPFILVTSSVSEDFAVQIMKLGADDYILKDRMARLPNAVTNAYNTYLLEEEKQKNLNEIVTNQAIMKEAEQLAHIGSWELSLLTGKVKWSNECYRILGYEPHQTTLTLSSFLKHIYSEDVASVEKSLGDVFFNQFSQEIKYRLHTKLGDKKYIHSKMMVTLNNDKKPVSIIGFIQDVTDSYDAQEKLYQSEANLRTILTTAQTAYILINTSLEIVSFNPLAAVYAKEIFKKELVVAASAYNYFHDSRKAALTEIIQKVLAGQNVNYEISFVTEEGTIRWFYARWFNISHTDAHGTGLVMEISDITERKNNELELEKITDDLRRRNDSLQQFMFIVSHNLRAPVANIIGLSDLLTTDRMSAEEADPYLKALFLSSQKLDNVIIDLNQILQIDRIGEEQKEPVSIKAIIADILVMIEADIVWAEADIQFENLLEQEPFTTVKSYLQSILYNLISNGIKFRMPDVKPVVKISSSIVDNYIVIKVKDNGKGIDLKKYGDRIFGMYQRFDVNIAGTGMGLCLVKRQAEAMGGNITVESEVLEGTEFTIKLPV